MDKKNDEILETSMALQEMPERNSSQELGYKEKTEDEIYLGEDILQQLREMKAEVQNALAVREGYQDYKVTNVVHYNKDVELVAIETGEIEYVDLSVITAEELETGEIIEIYYLDGEEADFSQLIKKYESATPIKDVIIATNKNLELAPEEQDKEFVKDDLEELEKERKEEKEQEKRNEQEQEQEQENEEQQQLKNQMDIQNEEQKKTENQMNVQNDNKENNLTGIKPKYVVQTIDVDKTYVDDKTTVREAFKIPGPVKELAIAKPLQEDENVLTKDMTMYMLDSTERVIEEADGQTITDLFQADDATGKRPRTEENTKFDLSGHAERDKTNTLRRFESKKNPNMHLSVEEQTITEYAQVYAGRKTLNGNDSVEVQLETRNVPVQTSLEMQKISAGYKGTENIKNIDEEVDLREEKGYDLKNIPVENIDGKVNNTKAVESAYIPGTEMTWEELSDKTGENIQVLQERFNRELENGKKSDDIVAEIEYDYEMTGHEHEHRWG